MLRSQESLTLYYIGKSSIPLVSFQDQVKGTLSKILIQKRISNHAEANRYTRGINVQTTPVPKDTVNLGDQITISSDKQTLLAVINEHLKHFPLLSTSPTQTPPQQTPRCQSQQRRKRTYSTVATSATSQGPAAYQNSQQMPKHDQQKACSDLPYTPIGGAQGSTGAFRQPQRHRVNSHYGIDYFGNITNALENGATTFINDIKIELDQFSNAATFLWLFHFEPDGITKIKEIAYNSDLRNNNDKKLLLIIPILYRKATNKDVSGWGRTRDPHLQNWYTNKCQEARNIIKEAQENAPHGKDQLFDHVSYCKTHLMEKYYLANEWQNLFDKIFWQEYKAVDDFFTRNWQQMIIPL